MTFEERITKAEVLLLEAEMTQDVKRAEMLVSAADSWAGVAFSLAEINYG